MNVPGGIRVKLALALVAIVGGALAAAYLIVVPTLRSSLVDAKLDQLQIDASEQAMPNFFSNYLFWQEWAENYSYNLDARIVVYSVLSTSPPTLKVDADSRSDLSRDVQNDEVAERALETGEVTRGTVERGGTLVGEVAFPISETGPVVLFAAPLSDQTASVALVKRRLFVAAAVAMGVALALGLAAAAMHARRIRRLERAAERIAGGRFDEPVVDPRDDELGELARTFERMRVQVAQLDSARKEFIANASHELRTPLFSLGGFLELMDDEDLDEATRQEFLTTMREQVERLTKLATDLLDLSRMDAGRLRVDHELVDLGETARIVGDELRALAERSGHRLEVEADEDVGAVGDEERILQVGRSLAVNALSHTPPGTRVVVRAAERGDRAVLEVEDDGPGIQAEHAARVFERFYRVEGGLASGSGLGLAIARELAELMGGTVRMQTRPGRTVFLLELPRSYEAAEQPALAHA